MLSICWICLMPRLRSFSTTDASGIMTVLACDVDDQDGMALSWGGAITVWAGRGRLLTSSHVGEGKIQYATDEEDFQEAYTPEQPSASQTTQEQAANGPADEEARNATHQPTHPTPALWCEGLRPRLWACLRRSGGLLHPLSRCRRAT